MTSVHWKELFPKFRRLNLQCLFVCLVVAGTITKCPLGQ